MFAGSIPALVTPFRDGEFAEDIFRDFVEWQIAEGTGGLVPCGTTGEAATMTFDEHFTVVRVCVEQAKGRVPVIAGCGSNDTRIATENLAAAKEAGADAGLMVPPYYNKPNQDGIFAHFEYVRARCDLPIVLYNIPGRTAADILPETMARIVGLGGMVGVKDASGDIDRVNAQRALCGKDFCQLSGDDGNALGFNAMGGKGCVSVTANVAPKLCADFQTAMAEGRWDDALALNDKLWPLHRAMFTDASPGPVKYALSKVRSDFPPEPRLPMTMPNEASRAAVDAALGALGMV